MKIQPEQLARLQSQVTRSLRYYSQLMARMEALGATSNTPLLSETVTARNAVYALRVAIHYRQCDPGTVGLPSNDEPQPVTK